MMREKRAAAAACGTGRGSRMALALEDDPEFQETVSHVADFESVTPAGYRRG
jgi:hypothetical protein